MATLRATLLDFHFAYKHAPRGYAHLQLELRAWVCGAWAVEVVVGSGGVATAFSCYRGGGCPVPSRAIRTLCVMCVLLLYVRIRLSPLIMILKSLTPCMASQNAIFIA